MQHPGSPLGLHPPTTSLNQSLYANDSISPLFSNPRPGFTTFSWPSSPRCLRGPSNITCLTQISPPSPLLPDSLVTISPCQTFLLLPVSVNRISICSFVQAGSPEWATETCLAHGQNLSQIPLLSFLSDRCSKCTIMSKPQVHRNNFLQAHPCCFLPGPLHPVTELNLFRNIPLYTHSLCLESPSHWSQWSLQPEPQLSCLHVQMSTFLSPLHNWPSPCFREL